MKLLYVKRHIHHRDFIPRFVFEKTFKCLFFVVPSAVSLLSRHLSCLSKQTVNLHGFSFASRRDERLMVCMKREMLLKNEAKASSSE